MKKIESNFTAGCVALVMVSCSKDGPSSAPQIGEVENAVDGMKLKTGESVTFSAIMVCEDQASFAWLLDGTKVAGRQNLRLLPIRPVRSR